MKKILALILSVVMIFSFAGCGEPQQTACVHEYVSIVETEGEVSKVILTCKKCGEKAEAEVALPEKTITVEVPVEKEVIKEVVKEKEVIKEVEVPVYASLEEQLAAEDYDMLAYYVSTYSKLDSIKDYVLQNYYFDVTDEQLMEGVYDGLFTALNDPYSEYVPASESSSYYDAISNSYSGIGVTMFVNDDGDAEIQDVTKDSPAEAAGIQIGDVIYAVDGKNVRGIGLDVSTYVRGEIGTTVTVTVNRGGTTKTFTMTRKHLGISTVDYMVLDSGEGYIAVTNFNETTSEELAAAIRDFELKGIKKFVLDLRDNGGGEIGAAMESADQLMNAGVLYSTKNKAGDTQTYKTTAGRTSMQYVVLINSNTASAAELVAAAIKENGEGKLVGETTYGKGVIQLYAYVNDGSAIKLTEYEYFTPKGNKIHKIGVKPDYEVKLTNDCFDKDGLLVNDKQLTKALELLK